MSGSLTIERIFSRIISATMSLEAGLTSWSVKTPSDGEQLTGVPGRLEPLPAAPPRTPPPRDVGDLARDAARRPPGRLAVGGPVGSQRGQALGDGGPLWAGIEKFGVRWNTVSWRPGAAISGMDWMPDEPVPMTATRLPVRSTPSWGQLLVKYTSPWNRPVPSMSTALGSERQPVAITKNWAADLFAADRCARASGCASSSQSADWTRVENWMLRRKS